MTGSSATEKDMGEATEGRVSTVRLARVVKTESSQVGAVEMGLVVKVEQAVVRVVPDNTLPSFRMPSKPVLVKMLPMVSSHSHDCPSRMQLRHYISKHQLGTCPST